MSNGGGRFVSSLKRGPTRSDDVVVGGPTARSIAAVAVAGVVLACAATADARTPPIRRGAGIAIGALPPIGPPIRSSTTTTTAPPPTTSTTTAATTPTTVGATTSTTARATTTTSTRPATTTTTVPVSGPRFGSCPAFPTSNAWNADISAKPVNARSAAWVSSIGSGDHIHPDFGSDPDYGIPLTISSGATPLPITYTDYGDESDPGPFPIPANARTETGGDRHVLVVDQPSCTLFELYGAVKRGNGWDAASGARFDLRSNALRPEGWTSADAAGLPIAPGLARYDELATGHLDHALRFTINTSSRRWLHPATHQAGSTDSPDVPPMGARFRLKAGFDTSGYTGMSKVILEGLKRYGMIVADNGSDWYISGDTDPRWNDDDLNQLKRLTGSAFEAVETGEALRGP